MTPTGERSVTCWSGFARGKNAAEALAKPQWGYNRHMADQDIQGVTSAPPATGERRQGGDRRGGDRTGDRRTRDSFGGVGHKGTSFLDHPWWVVGTVVFGVLVGMLIMLATSTPTVGVIPRNIPAGGIDVIVKPELPTP